ncbi:eukaryotic peptide chain release factor GTP-binding subunit ERF3B-like [Raphanus sativus]|nr:eukaryotic peptide chain release factor GTP-binding subunit ERF3B-like [Raphanus sativus]
MDIEAALQVDSAEENNRVGVVVPAGQNTDGVEILDIMEQELKDEVQESTPIPDVQQVKPEFVAHLQIVDLPANVIFIAGYKAILHIHSAVEECEIIELISQIDLKTRKPMKTKKIMHVSKNGTAVVCRIQVSNSIRVENFSDFLQFGKFTLRTQEEKGDGFRVAPRSLSSLNSNLSFISMVRFESYCYREVSPETVF